jgi:hypothetical protein
MRGGKGGGNRREPKEPLSYVRGSDRPAGRNGTYQQFSRSQLWKASRYRMMPLREYRR